MESWNLQTLKKKLIPVIEKYIFLYSYEKETNTQVNVYTVKDDYLCAFVYIFMHIQKKSSLSDLFPTEN